MNGYQNIFSWILLIDRINFHWKTNWLLCFECKDNILIFNHKHDCNSRTVNIFTFYTCIPFFEESIIEYISRGIPPMSSTKKKWSSARVSSSCRYWILMGKVLETNHCWYLYLLKFTNSPDIIEWFGNYHTK